MRGSVVDLAGWLLDRADADPTLGEDVKITLLAALDGDEALDQALGGRHSRPAGEQAGSETTPSTTSFLKSLTVAGFRGIGPEARLTLQPAPGLVVVAGRNGSGKSTFVEALELALSGQSLPGWRATWLKDNWRNLHRPDPCAIRVEITAEGAPSATIGVDWAAGADAEARQVWVQTAGAKRTAGLGSLGWREPLELFRPILSYDDLGGMLSGKQSELHDALESALGLGQLTRAAALLAARARALGENAKVAAAGLRALKPQVSDLGDERAAALSALLAKRAPDLAAVRRLITGAAPVDDSVDHRLRGLAELQIPDAAGVESAARELDDALDEQRALGAAQAASERARDELLGRALAFHDVHGDGPCPVCGEGTLNRGWARSARMELGRSQEIRVERFRVDARVAAAKQRVDSLLATRWNLDGAGLDLEAIAPALAAVQSWRDAPADDTGRAKHLRDAFAALTLALSAVAAAAQVLRTGRQGRWGDVAMAAGAWLVSAEQAAEVEPSRKIVDTASSWFKANLKDLRNERLAPMADQARAIWAALKQESNVDLGVVSLEGAANRRHVNLAARVDGEATPALAVMSQGELHALTLALFIPRALSPASPFGFLVLDDPIQAMDPSKVDGFLQVLKDLAATRQVIVFTHDDRLPDALRRSDIPGRILEVGRGPGSRVEVQLVADAASRYLSDADAVAKDVRLDAEAKARVVPGLCRFAIEAACRDAFFSSELSGGGARLDIEKKWEAARTTRDRLALIVPPPGLDAWIDRFPYRRTGLNVARATHHGLTTDAVHSVRLVADLISDIRGRR